MDTLSKEYILLFKGITEAIGEMEDTVRRLKAMQTAAEAYYIDREEDGRCAANASG